MRDLELEMKMAKETVCGVTLTDLRKEMVKAFSNKELIPSIFPELNSPDFLESSQFAVILDTACFAALSAIRLANGMEVPDGVKKSDFPVGSYVIIRGHKWKKEDHSVSWWLKDRCAVVIGNHRNEEGGEKIEVAVTKPSGDMIINIWLFPEELELAKDQRLVPVWEQE